jgi:hypothetical protein
MMPSWTASIASRVRVVVLESTEPACHWPPADTPPSVADVEMTLLRPLASYDVAPERAFAIDT